MLGQCEPFTAGWKMVMVLPDNSREVLLSGAYSDLHRIMETCNKVENPEDVKKRAEELWKLQNSSVTETVAVQYGSKPPPGKEILEPTKTGEMPVLDSSAEILGEGFFELKMENRVMVALVADPDKASELAELKKCLLEILDRKPKGLILDLSRIQNLASRAATELVVFRDQCEKAEVQFGLCSLRQNVQRLFETLDPKNPPTIYPSLEAARLEIH